MKLRLPLVIASLVLAGMLTGKELPDLNTVSGKEFVRISGLRIRPQVFERIRQDLGGWENPAQLAIVFDLHEGNVKRITNAFICLARPAFSQQEREEDDRYQADDSESIQLPIAGCTIARLENLPGISPRMAYRLAHACRLPATRYRWQLLSVRGMTPALYGQIRHAIEDQRRELSRNWKHETRIGLSRSKEKWKLPVTLSLDLAALETRIQARAGIPLTPTSHLGGFGLRQYLPSWWTSLSGFIRYSKDDLALTLGRLSLRSPLGLLAGKSRSLGNIDNQESSGLSSLPTLDRNPVTSRGGLSLEWTISPLTLTALVAHEALPLNPERLTNSLSTQSPSALLGGAGDAWTSVTRMGLNAGLRIHPAFNLSAGWVRDQFETGFVHKSPSTLFTGATRDHLLASGTLRAGYCTFFLESVYALESGIASSGKTAHGLAAGISLEEGDTRAGIILHTRSRIHPGLLDGAGARLSDERACSIDLRTSPVEGLALKAGLALVSHQTRGIRHTTRLECDWRITPGIRCRGRSAYWHDADDRKTYAHDITCEYSINSLYSLTLSGGQRIRDETSGHWLSAIAGLDLGSLRLQAGYSSWLTEEGVQVWPSRLVLSLAGEGFLGGVSGSGQCASLLISVPGKSLRWGGVVRLGTTTCAWKDPATVRTIDLACFISLRP